MGMLNFEAALKKTCLSEVLSKLWACLTVEALARQVLGENTSIVGGLIQSLGGPPFNVLQKCSLSIARKYIIFSL